VNTDLDQANTLNQTIYQYINLRPEEATPRHDLIVSQSRFDAENYGEAFIEDYKKRLGLTSPGGSIAVLRSTIMDPWITETAAGSFLSVIEDQLRKAVEAAIDQLGYGR
jgi:hypothetical protein